MSIGIAAVVLFLIGGWWALSSAKWVSPEQGPITIGFIGPLTGDGAFVGTIDKAAVELAVNEINNSGGINGREWRVIYEDGQCAATPAINAANKLISVDGASAIIGGLCSTETASFAPSAMQHKVIVISYGSSAPNLSQTGKYFFRDYPSDANQGRFAAEYIFNTLGARKIAIVYHVGPYGNGIKDIFSKRILELGGKIVAEESAPQSATDYRTILTKVKAADPDYIYTPMYAEGASLFIRQAKDIGVRARFLGPETFSDPKFIKDMSGLANIMYAQLKTSETEDFKRKILAKTGGEQLPASVANAYDAVHILKLAIEKAGGTSSTDKIADALRATNYDGASGHIEFDQNGDMKEASYEVMKIEKGVSMRAD